MTTNANLGNVLERPNTSASSEVEWKPISVGETYNRDNTGLEGGWEQERIILALIPLSPFSPSGMWNNTILKATELVHNVQNLYY